MIKTYRQYVKKMERGFAVVPVLIVSLVWGGETGDAGVGEEAGLGFGE